MISSLKRPTPCAETDPQRNEMSIMLLGPDELRETQDLRAQSVESSPYKTARIETIDSIFTANTDIFSLLTWDSIRTTRVGTLLAIYCWVTPLVVTLTSETLSVVFGVLEENTSCLYIRTLNFENEENIYWRNPMKINDQFLGSMSLWNTTAPLGDSSSNSNMDEFDYHDGPRRQFDMFITTKSTLMSEAVVRKEATDEICGVGWNCSYQVSFVAPGYKCQELASGVNSQVKKLGNATAPFNTSIIAPMGNHTYYAVNDQGDYVHHQIVSVGGGIPKQDPSYPENLGVLRTEPIMWIGYATVDDLSVKQPINPGTEEYMKAYTPVIIGCEHYEVNYTVQFNHTRGDKLVDIKQRKFFNKVIDTTYTPEEDPDKRLLDRTQAVPDSNYVFPTDVKKYRRTAAYHSIGSILRQCLNGSITMPYSDARSDLLYTRLFTRLNYLPIKNLQDGIQRLYEDIIVSIFEEPSFTVVFWAADGKPSGTAKGGPSTAYPCQRHRIATFFDYNMTQLLIVYAASIFLSGVSVLVGLQAYLEEGTMRDMKPSSIMEASRASSLGVLGACEGRNAKIGYGVVHEEAGRSVRSFGAEGNVEQ
ncbi:hypothetical protein FBEOM_6759 [Fusarium beomiforme]|uniref:Uncharacterized protein n=1 Tax=Fusarium beomiforme TaxID=44412 RepID=A0A9P5AID0_9HYPO|nr:hypothetical protein FBEOM_6759 [Fusarium beomiforme]